MFPSLVLYVCNLCHVTNVHCVYGNTVLFHCVVFLSTLYLFIPSLTSIKSLHPQTDQREGLSVSLLTLSLQYNTDFKWGQPSFLAPLMKTPMSPPCKTEILIIALPYRHSLIVFLFAWSLSSSCMPSDTTPPNCVSISLAKTHKESLCS